MGFISHLHFSITSWESIFLPFFQASNLRKSKKHKKKLWPPSPIMWKKTYGPWIGSHQQKRGGFKKRAANWTVWLDATHGWCAANCALGDSFEKVDANPWWCPLIAGISPLIAGISRIIHVRYFKGVTTLYLGRPSDGWWFRHPLKNSRWWFTGTRYQQQYCSERSFACAFVEGFWSIKVSWDWPPQKMDKHLVKLQRPHLP